MTEDQIEVWKKGNPMHLSKLNKLKIVAQADADRTGKPLAILNLNPYSPLYVIREWRDNYRARELIARIDPRN